MAQVCHLSPNEVDDLSFVDFLMLIGHCDQWLEIKKKLPEW